MVVAKEATTKEIHEKPPKMNVSRHYTPGDATLSHSVRICGDVVGPKYALMSIVNGRGMPKSSQAISKLMSSVRIRYPPNLMTKMVI